MVLEEGVVFEIFFKLFLLLTWCMPAVTVLPLRSTTVSSTYPNPNTHIIENMSSQEGVREVDSAPTPHIEKEGSTPAAAESGGQDSTSEQGKGGLEAEKTEDTHRNESSSGGEKSLPSRSTSYPPVPPHQTQPGYYVAYNQSQITPEPPSPAGPAGTVVYDLGSFMQPPSAGFHNSPFAAPHQYGVNPVPQPPHSPSQNTSGSMGGILPASPLFPRITGQATPGLLDQHNIGSIQQQRGTTPLSPGPPYLSPQIGPSSMYPHMGAYAGQPHNGTSNSNNSPDDFQGWGDNR